MKSCELCESPARMYCESDQASLCWDCDLKVHGVNFLVARHSRTLLCHVCQSPTPWSATGSELGPTVSICQKCSAVALPPEERETRQSDVLDLDGVGDDGGDSSTSEEEDEELEEEDERENQVVPGCSTPPPVPLPTATTFSSSEEGLRDDANDDADLPCSCSSLFSLKRNRDCYSDLGFQEQSSLVINRRENIALPSRRDKVDPCINDDGNAKPLKERRTEPILDRTVQGRTRLIKESMDKIEREMASNYGTSTGILGLCRLSRDPEVV